MRSALLVVCVAASTAFAGGKNEIKAVANDSAGQALGQAMLIDQTIANNAPFIAMQNPGSPLSGTVSLVAEPKVAPDLIGHFDARAGFSRKPGPVDVSQIDEAFADDLAGATGRGS